MSILSITLPSTRRVDTLGDLLTDLGDVSPNRVRLHPPIGTATEQDVVEIHARENRLCELVDGTLVEKPMGSPESVLASLIIGLLVAFDDGRNLGLVTGEAGLFRLFAGMIRIPDVAYCSAARLPGGQFPKQPIWDVIPDLIVEVLSPSNSAAEMIRKRREYFGAGVRVVWMIDPKSRTAEIYTAVDQFTVLTEDQSLTGGDVLPGFEAPLRRIFGVFDHNFA